MQDKSSKDVDKKYNSCGQKMKAYPLKKKDPKPFILRCFLRLFVEKQVKRCGLKESKKWTKNETVWTKNEKIIL